MRLTRKRFCSALLAAYLLFSLYAAYCVFVKPRHPVAPRAGQRERQARGGNRAAVLAQPSRPRPGVERRAATAASPRSPDPLAPRVEEVSGQARFRPAPRLAPG